MGAPSPAHERRVEDLRVLAILTGHTERLAFPPPLRPDVAAVHPTSPDLFLADAKATEHPDRRATQRRLAQYVAAYRPLSAHGYRLLLAVAHDGGHVGWSASLASILASFGLQATRAGELTIAYDLTVSWLHVGDP